MEKKRKKKRNRKGERKREGEKEKGQKDVASLKLQPQMIFQNDGVLKQGTWTFILPCEPEDVNELPRGEDWSL